MIKPGIWVYICAQFNGFDYKISVQESWNWSSYYMVHYVHI